MPPLDISDIASESGSDGPDEIPAKAPHGKDESEIDEDDDDDDEDEEDEYKVEKILNHDFTEEGITIYQIKWLGYDKKSDLTWEPVENLNNAPQILKAYHEKIGGPPKPPQKASAKKVGRGKKKRTAADAFEDSPAPATASTRRKSNNNKADAVKSNGTLEKKKRELPVGSWEDHITRVVSIVESGVGDKRTLGGLLEWNADGSKTEHSLKVLRTKCPQRLLDYYEQHLVFKGESPPSSIKADF
ncbi:Hypothetical protein R9X50_00550600 [Acrodontium crateriforme]|uniref:Chromo domain-containing protein n=1 Tax=Acrodontium crateriforme TaxID=150365 RepID=A0AAQ3RAX7_9PEZI|nr:Hypothetical protein R9X50_00550600 [Acrodontium crateriforme]